MHVCQCYALLVKVPPQSEHCTHHRCLLYWIVKALRDDCRTQHRWARYMRIGMTSLTRILTRCCECALDAHCRFMVQRPQYMAQGHQYMAQRHQYMTQRHQYVVQRRQSMVQRHQYIVHRMHGLRFRRELNLHKLLRCASGSSERFAMVQQTGTTFIPP